MMSSRPSRPGGAAAPVDVCVLGTGPVGASLALALARRGLRVALQGATARPAGSPDLRAYALNAASVRLLDELRVWGALPADARTPVHDMRIAGDRGGQLHFSAWQQCVGELAWIVDAAALDEALAQALRYAPHVERVDAPVPAALRAICEGRDSATRAALGVHYARQPYAHHAVAARLVSDRPHDGVAWQWFRAPDVLALLPFDRPEAGHSFGLVWSQPAAQAAQWCEAAPEAFEAALNDATQGSAGTLRLASARMAWPLVSAQAEPWCGDGWVLLGDAAHAVHPLAGQGLNLGLADVSCLAQVLDEARRAAPWRSLGDARTLRRYARERRLPTQAMSHMVDGLWQLFSRDEAALASLRNEGMTLLDRLSPLKRWLAGQALG
jgi:2-polyprenyl-6-methoxyphenol hydroxylase-like FAD-dependent oxidoreductase